MQSSEPPQASVQVPPLHASISQLAPALHVIEQPPPSQLSAQSESGSHVTAHPPSAQSKSHDTPASQVNPHPDPSHASAQSSSQMHASPSTHASSTSLQLGIAAPSASPSPKRHNNPRTLKPLSAITALTWGRVASSGHPDPRVARGGVLRRTPSEGAWSNLRRAAANAVGEGEIRFLACRNPAGLRATDTSVKVDMRYVVLVAGLVVNGCYDGAAGVEDPEGATEGASSGSPAVEDDGDTGNPEDDSDGDADGSGSGSDDGPNDSGDSPEPTDDPLHGLPTGDEQWELLCSRGHADVIATALCAGDEPPTISSITDLLELVGLGFEPGNQSNGENGNPGFTFVYHSTAVSTRFVNPINPRAIVFTGPVGGIVFPPSGIPNPDLVMSAFTRGEPFVEMVANDPVDDELRFYLFRFELPCEADPGGCGNADLLTPAVESGFTGWSMYDDGDVNNTVVDCLQCHQPDGPDTPKQLRMQELEEGWTHWFYPNRPENRLAMESYVEAHEGEDYGGIPGELLTYPLLLENGEGSARPVPFFLTLVNQGFDQQPNEFFSVDIRAERNNAGCQCYGCPNEPPLDAEASCSATWDAIYDAAVKGEEIAVPYFDGRITDPAKLTDATGAYRSVMDGTLLPDQMPDIRDIINDEALPYLSYRPAPALIGREILQHMCQHCHNSSLDQSISRAGFNVEELDNLPQAIKDEAIQRLQRADDDVFKMPPPRFHTLSENEIALVTHTLEG